MSGCTDAMGLPCSHRCSRLVREEMAAGTEGSSLQAKSNLEESEPEATAVWYTFDSKKTGGASEHHRKGSIGLNDQQHTMSGKKKT